MRGSNKKCFECLKKTHLYGIKCKCENIYCYACIDINVHKCTFDYKLEQRKFLLKNEKIEFEKVSKI